MVFYYSMFFISLVLMLVYAYIFHKHYDVNLTIIAVLIPITNLAFVLMGNAQTAEEAVVALRLTYIGGCYLIVFAMFLIFDTCGVILKPWMRTLIILVSTVIFVSTLTIGTSWNIFYKEMPDIATAYGATYLTNKHYGFMHTIFYVMVGLYYAATIAVIIYSFIKKKQVPRSILVLIVLSVTVAMIGFFGARLITRKIELLPLTYNLGLIIYLIIASRLRLYDVSDSVIDSLVQKGETGFVSIDGKNRYLGSNDTAKEMLPELNDCTIDKPIKLQPSVLSLIEEFKKDETKNKGVLESGDKIYELSINNMKVGMFHKVYQLLITDDTANQNYIRLMQTYNSQLETEVKNKTEHIIEMQEKLVLGMATMVEGRDNSTGGHIRRTSEVVRFLVEEMKKEDSLHLSNEFYLDVIKAAPMHDLGKITIDDAILRKPGKFTPEEYEIMKTHAEQGARIVRQILEGTDDQKFAEIAVNVAHYHHERCDGSGYPHKLLKDEIPLEARIMAIADVYDALVSKRVYKDEFSFEEANKIILESMGKHFDKDLEKYYLQARERIEEYYSKNK